MGILDDAIREHLELKRRHGAQPDEIQQLEDEAFGLPTRPGEPDFERSEDDADSEAEPAADHEREFEAAGYDEDTGPGRGLVEEDTDGLEWEDAPAGEDDEDFEEEPSDAASARVDYAHLEDTVVHESLAEDTGEEEIAESEAEAEEVESGGGELDIDGLELDFGPPSTRPETEESDLSEAEVGDEELLADLDDVAEAAERDFDRDWDAEDEDDEGDPEGDEEEPAGPATPAPGEGAGEPDEGEDLLEETPEFLKDTPEGDALWFEQGSPKDFDFDDD